MANIAHHALMVRLKEERPPSNVIQHLHRFIRKTISETYMYLTLVVVEIDLETQTLTVGNAGHPDLLVWKQKTHELQSISNQMSAVGFGPRLTGDLDDVRIPIESGDRIVLYTDGFTETRDKDGELLGADRFKQLVERHIRLPSADFLDGLFKATDAFRLGEPEDDRTLALVEIK